MKSKAPKSVHLRKEWTEITGDIGRALVFEAIVQRARQAAIYDARLSEERDNAPSRFPGKPPVADGWVWAPAAAIAEEALFNAQGAKTALRALNWLVESGLLERRENPFDKWNKGYQYRVRWTRVLEALREAGYNEDAIPLWVRYPQALQNTEETWLREADDSPATESEQPSSQGQNVPSMGQNVPSKGHSGEPTMGQNVPSMGHFDPPPPIDILDIQSLHDACLGQSSDQSNDHCLDQSNGELVVANNCNDIVKSQVDIKGGRRKGKKTEPTEGDARGPSHQQMVEAVCEVTRLEMRGSSVVGRIVRAAADLRRAGYTPEDVRSLNAFWYANDWRGQRGSPPTPEQLAEGLARMRRDKRAPARSFGFSRANSAAIADYAQRDESYIPPGMTRDEYHAWFRETYVLRAQKAT